MGSRVLIEQLEHRQLLSGVTLITHGWQSETGRPAWLDTMASKISQRAGSGASIYSMVVGVSGNSASVISFTKASGVDPSTSSNPEIIIKLDWSAASGVFTSPVFSAGDIASQLIAHEFFTQSPAAGITQPLAQLPIHLIGHSRGGSLVSALAQALGRRGVWVDEVTTLDPHPVTTPNSDPAVATTDNVVFTDNYYQTNGFLTDGFITGVTVGGAQNVNLTAFGYGHKEVHDYYDSTIGISGTVGFAWSRIAGGIRPAAGSLFSGAARVTLPITASGAAAWDNIEITNRNAAATVVQGALIPIQLQFIDVNKDATLTVGFDNDANPNNGMLTTGAASTLNTTVATRGTWAPFVSTSSLAPGT